MNGPAQGRLPLAVTQLLVLNPHWVPFCSPGGIDSVDSSLLHTDNDRMRKLMLLTTELVDRIIAIGTYQMLCLEVVLQ